VQFVPLRNQALNGVLAGLWLAVIQIYLTVGLGAYLGDAPAHGSSAHDAHGGKRVFHGLNYGLFSMTQSTTGNGGRHDVETLRIFSEQLLLQGKDAVA
jgi:hypothetical protein